MAVEKRPGMKYLNFDLEIGSGKGREYSLKILASPAGEAEGILYFPFDDLVLDNRLKDIRIALLRSTTQRRQAFTAEEQSVQDFGKALFDALLTGEVRSRYDVSLQRAKDQGFGLRLRLRIDPPELARLPWEFLYDSRQPDYICFSRMTPLVRYVERPHTVQTLAVQTPLRILGMISSPKGLPSLDIVREKQRLERALQNLKAAGIVELVWLEGQTWRDLQRAMRQGPWHIFHFIGHGGFDEQADEGLLILAEGDGSYKLSATQLTRLLVRQESLRLAVLNTCEGGRGSNKDIFSSTASILVRGGVPAVVAMQDEISDMAAIEFGHAFYEALADNLPVDAALSEARLAISMAFEVTAEWAIPVLYMRSPDGMLFHVDKRNAARLTEPARNGERQKASTLKEIAKREDVFQYPIKDSQTAGTTEVQKPNWAQTEIGIGGRQDIPLEKISDTSAEFIFYKSAPWWGLSIVVIAVSILGGVLANWVLNFALSIFNVWVEEVYGLIAAIVVAGTLWGILYIFAGMVDEENAFSSLFGLVIPYLEIADSTSLGELIGGILSALPLNFIVALGFAYGVGYFASDSMGADYTGAFFFVFGLISFIELVIGFFRTT